MIKQSAKLFVVANDPIYFKTIKTKEGGEIKIDAKGNQEVIDSCSEGDIAIVWLSGSSSPTAYFTVTDVSPRPDLIGQVEEFDGDNDRPHLVRLENDSTIRMDLRRDTYKILTHNNRAIQAKTLNAPLSKPLKIRWTVYKYTISGKELHLLGDDFEDPTLSEYTPPESGFELLERQDRQIFIKALGLDSHKSPSKRKLDSPSEEETEPKKKKTTPNKNSPVITRSSPRTTSPSPNKKSTPPTSPLYLSPRKSKQTDHYSPPPHVPKSRSPSPAKPKTKKTVQFEQGTKPPTPINPNPGRRASKRSTIVEAGPSSAATAGLPVTLQEGSVLAIRADVGKDFVVARVRKTTTIPAPAATTVSAQRDVERTAVPVTWLVEAHESILRGCYAAPEWHASVSWGAVVKMNVKMKYDKEKDMYWLVDKAQDLLALV